MPRRTTLVPRLSSAARRTAAATLIAAAAVAGTSPGRAADDPRPTTAPATRPAAAAEPSPVPAVLPADQKTARLFADLADPVPATREAARVALMGLDGRDLPGLERVVRASLPLDPSQAAVLKEIVTHVRARTVTYDARTGLGFLGVKLGMVTIGPRLKEPPPERERNPFDGRMFRVDPDANTGVVIVERMPGFCGARMLQNGDVIVSIAERPGLLIRTTSDMSDEVRAIGAGKTVTFVLMRQGRIVRVPVVLDPLPDAVIDPGVLVRMDEIVRDRANAAAEYWERTFVPMLKLDNG